MVRRDAQRADNCLGRHDNVFNSEGWVEHVTQSEVADLHQARNRIRDANLKAFGTAAPGRLRLWYFSLMCVGSEAARDRKAGIVAAYEAYVELLERLRSAALSRVSID
jgi:hypothetical protein